MRPTVSAAEPRIDFMNSKNRKRATYIWGILSLRSFSLATLVLESGNNSYTCKLPSLFAKVVLN